MKNEDWKVDSQPIKDNLKENLKDNLLEREDAELKEMLSWFRKGKDNPKEYGYMAMRKHFNIKCSVDETIGKVINDILKDREYQRQKEKAIANCYMPEYYNDIDYNALYDAKQKRKSTNRFDDLM